MKTPHRYAGTYGAEHSRKSYTKHKYMVAYFPAGRKGKIMNNLEKLYYNLHLLDEYYKDLPEVKEARNKLEKAMGDELYAKYEYEICNCIAENEKQGFIFGFQYAVSLLTNGKAVEV